MRIIKFRAWDKSSATFESFDFLYTKDVARFGKGKWSINYLQQFTGLLDKNGKEIYEGDILKNTKYNQTVEVFWKGCEVLEDDWIRWGGWNFRKVNKNENITKAIYSKQIEVIGNLYENENLLKVVKEK